MSLENYTLTVRDYLDDEKSLAEIKEKNRILHIQLVDGLDQEIAEEPSHYLENGARDLHHTYDDHVYSYTPIVYQNVFIQVISKKETKPDYAILHIHGAVFVRRLNELFSPYLEHLASYTNALIVTPDYRTPPRASFEQGLQEVIKTYEYLHSIGYDDEHIIIYSESSGVAVALNTLLRLNQLGYNKPKGAAFFCPFIGFDTNTESYKKYKDIDCVLSTKMIDYVKKALNLNRHPEQMKAYFDLSHQDLSVLPDLYIIAGEEEIIRDEVLNVTRKAAEAGVQVELTIFKGMFHSFQHSSTLKTSGEAFRMMFEHLNRLIK